MSSPPEWMSKDTPGFGPSNFALASGATTAQVEDITVFSRELEDWGTRMNLVGPSALRSFWDRHAFDSAQLLHVEQSARVWADVGTGAGFPGVILAILLKGKPNACVHLIESMAKRVAFLSHVVERLELPAMIHHARAEEIRPPDGLQVITARACAPFPRLFDYTHAFFKAGATGLFLKGREVQSEMTEARRRWVFTAEIIQSRSDPSGSIVRVNELAPRG